MISEVEHPNGRPSKYKAEFPRQAAKLCAFGATDEDLADFFDVSVTTITTWKNTHPRFLSAITKAKQIADEEVEKSLYQRAIGYSHEDVDIKSVALGNNQGSEIVQTPITKHYPPSEVACIFWLKNRQKDKWRDRADVVLQNPDGSALRQTLVIALSQAISAGKVMFPEVEQKAIVEQAGEVKQ